MDEKLDRAKERFISCYVGNNKEKYHFPINMLLSLFLFNLMCLFVFFSYPHQNKRIDDGKRVEYERGLAEENEATCQNESNPMHTSDFDYHLIITSKRSQEAEHQYNILNEEEEEDEEEARKSRTLDLFPVIEDQEKTGFAEKNTKPDQLSCNYYYYYEFMPLMN